MWNIDELFTEIFIVRMTETKVTCCFLLVICQWTVMWYHGAHDCTLCVHTMSWQGWSVVSMHAQAYVQYMGRLMPACSCIVVFLSVCSILCSSLIDGDDVVDFLYFCWFAKFLCAHVILIREYHLHTSHDGYSSCAKFLFSQIVLISMKQWQHGPICFKLHLMSDFCLMIMSISCDAFIHPHKRMWIVCNISRIRRKLSN